ncbi:MAG TPA: sensor histidine kinase, partial [Candidatus Sulfotelmatobacter sp.]|nr:sensor histidine kinase [Candidatus Sulfotelmatobacter sp.]
EVLAGLAALRIQALKDRSRAQKLLDDFGKLHDLVEQKSDAAPSGPLLERLATRLQAAAGANAYATFTVGPGGELEHGPCVAPTGEMLRLLLALPPERTPAPATLAGSKVRSFCREGLRTFGPALLEGLPVNECVCVPITRGDGAAIAVVLLLYLGSARSLPGPDILALSELYARFGGIAVHNLELFATTARQSTQLRQLLERVVEAQEAERRRISMDLHDWVVQGLAAPAFQLQLVERLLEPTQAHVKAELDVARNQLNAAGDELRRIMKGLRPYLLDELGLFRAAQAYADDWSKSQRVACTVTKDPDAELPRGSKEGLVAFRIVQEALNNIAKHADATEVQITITKVSDRVQVRIKDNGNGFQPGATREQEHFGLLGMHERAASVGGSLEVIRPPEGGYLVVCSIPVTA